MICWRGLGSWLGGSRYGCAFIGKVAEMGCAHNIVLYDVREHGFSFSIPRIQDFPSTHIPSNDIPPSPKQERSV